MYSNSVHKPTDPTQGYCLPYATTTVTPHHPMNLPAPALCHQFTRHYPLPQCSHQQYIPSPTTMLIPRGLPVHNEGEGEIQISALGTTSY